ncbi:MAG: 4-(cytidine 5'-diphospho)-2-C-methyl-D-erythritol kinase [Terracidiphilus sp.]|nr:4-(cytidine 5'-diphospho)-2-C-methyl-D-erythritol kinase [Terracidiphilus sp.]
MPTHVRSHAKINLGLAIGAPRPDGFHALSTVYQTLDVHDTVTVSARPAPATALRLTSNDERVPTDARNTAWKMAALALEALGITAEVEIHIEKRLPVQGGLGAGSANAVAALVGLEAELGVWSSGAASQRVSESASQRVSEPASQQVSEVGSGKIDLRWWSARRLEIAAEVGSDVPLFLIGGATLGVDRGQEVYPLPDFEPVWCVVATPAVGVSTPQAFHDWDAHCLAEGLTADRSASKLNELSRAYASAFAGAIPGGENEAGSSGIPSEQFRIRRDRAGSVGSALVRTGILRWIENDFELVVFRQQPSLAEIKRLLAAAGTPEAALHASLSGSGSALFGLYLTREDAEAARERLRVAGVASLLTQTLPRSGYWSQMLTHKID